MNVRGILQYPYILHCPGWNFLAYSFTYFSFFMATWDEL